MLGQCEFDSNLTWLKINGLLYTYVRDPIFYRWHAHIEDLVQEYRDKKLPPYTEHDFTLGDGVRKVFRNNRVRNEQI